MQYTFLYISLSLFSTTTASNFQKRLSYTFNGGNVVRVLVDFFSLPLILTLYLIVGRSHFVTAATNKKNVSFFFVSLYISVALFLVELRWPAAFFLFFSVFLFLYIPNLWTWQLSLILKTTRIQKQFLLSVFVFIDSLAVSTLQDAGGYAISRQNNLELHLGCHTCWLSYFTLVCLWCSRAGGPTVTWLPNFLGWVDYRVFPRYFPFVVAKTPLTQGWGSQREQWES